MIQHVQTQWILESETAFRLGGNRDLLKARVNFLNHPSYTVGYATTNDATTNECYNEQFLSMKSGCYNERGGILSADVARSCACALDCICFSNLHVQGIKVK
jgi:hypothetical protein